MSKGRPIIKVRVEASTRVAIARDIVRKLARNDVDQDFDMSAWLREAIAEKLDHLRRSNKKPSRKLGKVLDNVQTLRIPVCSLCHMPVVECLCEHDGGDR